MNTDVINKAILKYLLDNGITITHLAKKLNLPNQNLGRILNHNDIKISQVFKISKALGLNEYHFFNTDASNRANTIHAIPKPEYDRLQKKLQIKFAEGFGLVYVSYDAIEERLTGRFAELKQKPTTPEADYNGFEIDATMNL
jgi:MoaA/NifB/PqqE/SkfB family radical SAM enzyme